MQFLIGSLFGSKRDLLDLLLQKGMVMVHLDARCDGVDVPPAHGSDHHLRLNLSLNFGIDDFGYDDDGVSASLSFRGQRHFCLLPWHAIFAITSHIEPIGYLWPEDLPPELATRLNAAAPGVAAGTEHHREHADESRLDGHTGARRPSLRLVRDGAETDTAAPEPTAEAPTAATAPRRIARPGSGSAPAVQHMDANEPETAAADDAFDGDQGRRYGHLRVVK